MPLSCITPNGKTLRAFKIEAGDWARLRGADAKLLSACCKMPVRPMITAQGNQYFRHEVNTQCTQNHETDNSVALKHTIAATLDENGWLVKTEATVAIPEYGGWSVTVLAKRDGHLIAFCIVSGKSKSSDTLRIHRALAKQSIRAFWLFEAEDFPVTRLLPAANVDYRSLCAKVRLPALSRASVIASDTEVGGWGEGIEISCFTKAISDDRLWFGTLRDGDDAVLRVDSAFAKCPECNLWSNMVARVEVIPSWQNGSGICFKVSDVPSGHSKEIIDPHLKRLGVPTPRFAFDPTYDRQVLTNTCANCKSLMRESDHPDMYERAKGLTQTKIVVSANLARMLQRHPGARWRISEAL